MCPLFSSFSLLGLSLTKYFNQKPHVGNLIYVLVTFLKMLHEVKFKQSESNFHIGNNGNRGVMFFNSGKGYLFYEVCYSDLETKIIDA